jgi:hypothetical protein
MDGPAINSVSSAHPGVKGRSTLADGVQGEASAANKSGVFGHNTAAGYGVYGLSASGFGMAAVGGGDGSTSDGVGDLVLGGNRGEIVSFGWSLDLHSDGSMELHLDDNDDDVNDAALWIMNGDDTTVGAFFENGAKSAVLQTEDYGQRAVYSMESPEVWLEDFGTASLVDGEAKVALEPIFAQTVNLEVDYHVFLTALCDEPALLFVSDKRAMGFTVRGVTLDDNPSSCAFDYRIAAKRVGLEEVRLAAVSPGQDAEQEARQ